MEQILQDRRFSLLEVDDWLDKCPNDEPDSIIYDAQYPADVAKSVVEPKNEEDLIFYNKWADKYAQFGVPPDNIQSRLHNLNECFSAYRDMLDKDLEVEFEKLCRYYQATLDQVQRMLADLSLPAYVPDENLTSLQRCKLLKSEFNKLDKIRQERKGRLQDLRKQQAKHCQMLGIKVPRIEEQNLIPSEEELTQLAVTVTELEQELKRREQKYQTIRDQIVKCMLELDYSYDSDFERYFLVETPAYTESHMLLVSNFCNKLEKERAKNEERYNQLRSRLESLYDRLDVPNFERQQFFDKHDICKPSIMAEMETEIAKYEELKRQNIGKFIAKIQTELIGEYQRCAISQKEQEKFFSKSSVAENCNEDLLEEYEKELERVKLLYKENEEIFEKFKKWQDMWDLLIDLELKADDPDRFNNRGGQLLKEEKERKKLQRGLPKIENELIDLNNKFASSNGGKKFEVYDTNLDKYIAGCWDMLNEAKEQQKKERRAKIATTSRAASANQSRRPGGQPTVPARRTPMKRPAGCGVATPTPTPSKLKCQTISRLNIPPSAQKSNNKIASTPSELSLNEQEFEKMIIRCPTSAKKNKP